MAITQRLKFFASLICALSIYVSTSYGQELICARSLSFSNSRNFFFSTVLEGNVKTPQVVNGTSSLLVGRALSRIVSGTGLSAEDLLQPTSQNEFEMLASPMDKIHAAFGVTMDARSLLKSFIEMYQNQLMFRLASLIDSIEPLAPILGADYSPQWENLERYPIAKIDTDLVAKKIDAYFASLNDSTKKNFWSELARFLVDTTLMDQEIKDLFKKFRRDIQNEVRDNGIGCPFRRFFSGARSEAHYNQVKETVKNDFHNLMHNRLVKKYGEVVGVKIYTGLFR